MQSETQVRVLPAGRRSFAHNSVNRSNGGHRWTAKVCFDVGNSFIPQMGMCCTRLCQPWKRRHERTLARVIEIN